MKSLTLFRSNSDLNNIILARGTYRTYYRNRYGDMNSFPNVHPPHLILFQHIQLNLKGVK